MRYWLLNKLSPRKRTDQLSGFTLVEVLIIAPIMVLIIGGFITLIISMTGEVLSSRASNTLNYNIQNALERIEQDIRISTEFLAENNITLKQPQGYDNNVQNFLNLSNNGIPNANALILQTLVTDKNPLDPTRRLIYRSDAPGGGCTTMTPLTATTVYFIKDYTLWRRIIMPENWQDLDNCTATAWQRPSCQPDLISIHAFCQTEDIRLVDGISNTEFVVDYFARADSTTKNTFATNNSYTSAQRQIRLNTLSSVQIKLTASKDVAGRTITQSGTTRATKLNPSI